jgi:predicted metal-dependent hydrolase
MPQKTFQTKEVGQIVVTKRRGARYLRLRINSSGQIHVSVPYWTPYQAGLAFALTRKVWINDHRQTHLPTKLGNGDIIGKHHRLQIITANAPQISTRLQGENVIVRVPVTETEADVQIAATKAAERALKKEANEELPDRLAQLASKLGYNYSSVRIKRLTSRWGSCSSDKRITLNYFLMQLPWEMIDYVLIHELVHTKHLNHGEGFWSEMAKYVPEPKKTQKKLRQYKTIILPS